MQVDKKNQKCMKQNNTFYNSCSETLVIGLV